MNAVMTENSDLPAALIEVGQREQARIAAQLHDGLGQELAGIALMLQGIASRLITEQSAVLPELEGITRLVGEAIHSTRSLARRLSPGNLERDGLTLALEALCLHFGEQHGVQVTFTHHLHPGIEPNTRLANHLYCIAQEAMTNAVQHGGARVIQVYVTVLRRRKVRLTVTDDGTGLPGEFDGVGGAGLRIMRYRAEVSGGTLELSGSVPGTIKGFGARLQCECPLEPKTH